MAEVTRSASASVDANTAKFAPQISGNLYAGENLDAAAPCYIKAADGKVYMSNGAAADEAAKFDGMTPRAYLAGEAVTLYGTGTRFRFADGGLTPGTNLFVFTTAGRLGDAATVGGTVAVARAINTTDIRVTRSA